jgi:hypothetical protein
MALESLRAIGREADLRHRIKVAASAHTHRFTRIKRA